MAASSSSFITSGQSCHSFPALTRLKSYPSKHIMENECTTDRRQARPTMPLITKTTEHATHDSDSKPQKERDQPYRSPQQPDQSGKTFATHTGPEPGHRSQEARKPGRRRPHTNTADTTTTTRKPLSRAAVLKTAPGRKRQPSLHLNPPMAPPMARRVADSRRL